MNPDFQALRHQFTGHWEAIEQASAAERRLLVVELAKALAEWEVRQVEPLQKVQDLTRAVLWSALTQEAAAESERIAERLGAEKQLLSKRLQETAKRIEASDAQVLALTPEVDVMRAELSISGARLDELAERESALTRQIDAMRRLGDLQSKVDRRKAELGILQNSLQDGQDPTGVLTGLASLRETLLAYYDAYCSASRDISDRILSRENDVGQAPPSPEALSVPERLLALDRELKAIDRVLAGQLQQQDVLDREIRART